MPAGAVYKAIFSINNRFLKPVGVVAKDIFLPLADLLHSPREEQFSFLSFPQKRESIGFLGIGSLRSVDACLRRHDNVCSGGSEATAVIGHQLLWDHNAGAVY